MYAKFQINLMRYGEFPNKQRYQRDSLESYKGEILESLQNHQDVSWAIQSRFFDQQRLFRSFVQSFKWFYENLQTFKNSGRKKSGKMLQPQVNSKNLSAVHHNLLKLCFVDNRQ